MSKQIKVSLIMNFHTKDQSDKYDQLVQFLNDKGCIVTSPKINYDSKTNSALSIMKLEDNSLKRSDIVLVDVDHPFSIGAGIILGKATVINPFNIHTISFDSITTSIKSNINSEKFTKNPFLMSIIDTVINTEEELIEVLTKILSTGKKTSR